MQIERSGVEIKTELARRVNLGGRWYGKGTVVQLDQSDVEVMESRGISVKAKPGSTAMNIERAQPKTPAFVASGSNGTTAEEIAAAAEVSTQTKDVAESADTGRMTLGGSNGRTRRQR